MKANALKERLIYVFGIGVSIFLLFFVITFSWISYDVKKQCHEAKSEYGGDCVESLTAYLNDDKKTFKARNDAIWALGQLADSRALPVLRKYYTGTIPEREPLDKSISQYELKKAIRWCVQGNITSWMYRDQSHWN